MSSEQKMREALESLVKLHRKHFGLDGAWDSELTNAEYLLAQQPNNPEIPESSTENTAALVGLTDDFAEIVGELAVSTKWPEARDVGRLDDMSPNAYMRVGLDSDNDVCVAVWTGEGGGDVEFCCPGSGGGASPATREALIALMIAMEADNKAMPSKDWWALRGEAIAAHEAKQGGGV